MSRRSEMLAGALLSLYPPSWRVRYGAEMEALTADLGVSRRVVHDLLRGGLHAWMFPHPPADARERRRWRLEASVCTVSLAWCFTFLGMAAFSRGVDDSPLPGLSAPAPQAAYGVAQGAFSTSVLVVGLCLLLYGAIVVVPAVRARRGAILRPLLIPLAVAMAWLAASVFIGWLVSRTFGQDGPHDIRLIIGAGMALLAWAAVGGVALAGCAIGGGTALRRAQLRSHLLLPGAAGVIVVSLASAVASIAAVTCLVSLANRGLVSLADLLLPALGVALLVAASTVSLTSSLRCWSAIAGGLRRPAGGGGGETGRELPRSPSPR